MRQTNLDAMRTALAAIALAGAGLLIGLAPAQAHEEHGHPARIHEGTCEELGPVAFRLNGVGASVDLDNAPLATPAAVNPESAYQVLTSETPLETPLDAVLAASHAVMVYESDEAMEVIACGNVGGTLTGETLVTGLAEAGTPGHVGFALFAPEGDAIVVTLIIGHAMAPVSAGGIVEVDRERAADEDADHGHEGEDADHASEEEGHEDIATPAP